MREFDQTREFIDQIQKARSPAAICDALLSVTSRFGVRSLCAGTVPPTGSAGRDQVGHLILNTWPTEWVDRYIACDYIFHDPLVHHVHRTQRAMLWGEARSMGGGDARKVSQLFGEAREFDMIDGISLSISTLDGGSVVMSYSGAAVEMAPEDMHAISFISAYAVGHALSLRGADMFAELEPLEKECLHWTARGKSVLDVADLLRLAEKEVQQLVSRAKSKLGPGHTLHRLGEPPRLTPREKECLQWAALGKSEWEVSQILGISEHTAEKHLLNAKTKLGATNRAHAVAEAIRCGVLD
ncbi:LuxR C-terminal-related transcriptional regulator [Nitratireductor pacificus]|uniref:Autoinducer-binding domain-containing protein n=1 Tax=Nitratireductor pacificus pht-3B TaxID=391937 RepID=K2MHG4_9HYPH|nr:LuxR C-terminal-related transcriptional regulator [Nitratireductor pacificus]EKF20145.1 autoinducer-binding domain-containing protein [Nitratireductor pacificus pht-3B]